MILNLGLSITIIVFLFSHSLAFRLSHLQNQHCKSPLVSFAKKKSTPTDTSPVIAESTSPAVTSTSSATTTTNTLTTTSTSSSNLKLPHGERRAGSVPVKVSSLSILNIFILFF
jgi:hypothetical protein